MATILKIDSGDTTLGLRLDEKDQVIRMFIGKEYDHQDWLAINIVKDDAIELIEYLQRLIKKMD